MRHAIIIYWSDDDQAFIAEVPELAGCAADGETYQEALSNAEIVIGEWIETAREMDRDIPEPRGKLMFAQERRLVLEGFAPAASYADAIGRPFLLNATVEPFL